jgi:hypothetical protein
VFTAFLDKALKGQSRITVEQNLTLKTLRVLDPSDRAALRQAIAAVFARVEESIVVTFCGGKITSGL